MQSNYNPLQGNSTMFRLGYYICLLGTAITLLWIGIFKFTLTEAAAIRPLVENHPLTFWVYQSMSEQMVSNIVGVVEITTALGLILSVFVPKLSKVVGVALVITFLITLSYLWTTPNTWLIVDGIPITDFFILKDILFLGFGFMLIGLNKNDIN